MQSTRYNQKHGAGPAHATAGPSHGLDMGNMNNGGAPMDLFDELLL